MATQALLPVEDYLRASFERQPEYRDGILEERPMPEALHGLLQVFLAYAFMPLVLDGRLSVCTELRVKLRNGRFVLPDLCVFAGRVPAALPTSPPLAVIEILSKDDAMSSVLGKLEEYEQWGVAHVWLVDPVQQNFYVFDRNGLRRTSAFALAAFDLTIEHEVLFRQLNAAKPIDL